MFFGANEDVRGRLRANVFEGKYVVIFEGEFGGDFFYGNFAEEAVFVHG
jgi:hypothetical protein